MRVAAHGALVAGDRLDRDGLGAGTQEPGLDAYTRLVDGERAAEEARDDVAAVAARNGHAWKTSA